MSFHQVPSFHGLTTGKDFKEPSLLIMPHLNFDFERSRDQLLKREKISFELGTLEIIEVSRSDRAQENWLIELLIVLSALMI